MFEIRKTILLLLSYFVLTNGVALNCFRCSSTRENRATGVLPCSEFDYSQRFRVSCEKSTLCFKRTYTVPLGNGQEIHGVERGCAPQIEEGQKYNSIQRKWNRTETIIETVYKEGCSAGENNGRPGQPGEWCFCRYWLCNKSNSFREISYSLIALNVAGILLCMRGRY